MALRKPPAATTRALDKLVPDAARQTGLAPESFRSRVAAERHVVRMVADWGTWFSSLDDVTAWAKQARERIAAHSWPGEDAPHVREQRKFDAIAATVRDAVDAVDDPKSYAPHVRDQHLIDQAERAAVSGDTLDAIADGNAGPILLRTLHSAWVEAGAKLPAPSRLEYHRKRLQDVDAKIVELTAKLARLREARHEWTVSAVRALGAKTAIELNGRTCIVTSRGGLLFYRPQGGPPSQSLNRRKGV